MASNPNSSEDIEKIKPALGEAATDILAKKDKAENDGAVPEIPEERVSRVGVRFSHYIEETDLLRLRFAGQTSFPGKIFGVLSGAFVGISIPFVAALSKMLPDRNEKVDGTKNSELESPSQLNPFAVLDTTESLTVVVGFIVLGCMVLMAVLIFRNMIGNQNDTVNKICDEIKNRPTYKVPSS